MEDIKLCKICGLKTNRIGTHVLQFHLIKKQTYYNEFFKKENEGLCEVCGKETKFKGLGRDFGYYRSCGDPACTSTLAFRKPGRRRQQSELMKANWSNLEYKQTSVSKMAVSMKKKWAEDHEYRKKCTDARKKNWQEVEYREKTCEGQSKGAARRIAEVGNGHADRCYKSGYYFSKKVNKDLHYASSYELMAFEKLELDDNVASYDRAKMAIKYVKPDDHRMHRYVPDIFVEMKDGKKMLIEVKPFSMLEDDCVKAKSYAGKLYCDKKGFNYAVWSESDL